MAENYILLQCVCVSTYAVEMLAETVSSGSFKQFGIFTVLFFGCTLTAYYILLLPINLLDLIVALKIF